MLGVFIENPEVSDEIQWESLNSAPQMGCNLCIHILYSVSCILIHVSEVVFLLIYVSSVILFVSNIRYPKQCILYLVSNHLYLVSRLDGTNVSGMDCEPVSNLEANLRTDSRRRNRTRYLILNLKCYSINERSSKNTSTVPFNI